MAWTPAVPADPIRAVVAAAITTLTWTDPTDQTSPGHTTNPEQTTGPVPAVAARVAAALRLPTVTRVTTGDTPAVPGLVGVEAAYPDGRARVYALRGSSGEVVVVAVEFTRHP